MKTPVIAESFLAVDLGNFPLVSPKTFLDHYKQDPDRFEYDLGLAYSDNLEYLHQIEEHILNNAEKLENDDDFNQIIATCEFDYYTKALRRIISVNIFMEKLAENFDKHIDPEMATIETAMDNLYQAGEQSELFQKHMPQYTAALQTLKAYYSSLQSLSLQLIDFYNDQLEMSLLASTHYAATCSYPCKVNLHECRDALTVVIL
tara:strand:+ start:34464 stop:35075 length:612 start_codon:yes stop_codon:yes gene_type:complete